MNNIIRKELKEAIASAMIEVYNLSYGIHSDKQKEFLILAVKKIEELKLKVKK